MAQVATEYTATYTSFSGCDIVCTFGNVVIGELQAISVSVQREKSPIYTMGSAEPRSFSRGKRGIAGNLIFTVFDRDVLIEALQNVIAEEGRFQRNGAERNMQAMTIDQWDTEMTKLATGNESGKTDNPLSKDRNNATWRMTGKGANEKAKIFYDDEVPPFDVTISFNNEYGQSASMVIYGVELLNETTTFSIDNVTTEKACTFVARRIDYMKPLSVQGAQTESATVKSESGQTSIR